MLKKVLWVITLVLSFAGARAQTPDEVYNAYLDFNLARFEGQTNALELGEQILPNAAKLGDKTRISFYYSLGKLYEDDSQSIKALEYYEKVAAAVPNYYVVRRALGYLYAKQADGFATQVNSPQNDDAEKKRLNDAYAAAIKKALPHLEKAQACDADDDTLKMINSFYKAIGDKQGAASLKARLVTLSKTCIDLLDDK